MLPIKVSANNNIGLGAPKMKYPINATMACPNATTGIPTAFANTNFLNLYQFFFH
jgi:1-deoxy-D-xylulose 5-phosphate reductoisomerase